MTEETIVTPVEPVTPVAVETPNEPTEPQEPRTYSEEELKKAIGGRLARVESRYQRQIQEEREARIRLEERLSAAKPAEKQTVAGAPLLKDYTDFDEYVTAKAEWIADQRIGKKLEENDKAKAETQTKAQKQARMQAWGEKVKTAKDLPQDFSETLSESTFRLTPAMDEFILDSQQGPHLAYYLATHPEEAQDIATLTPIGAARKLTLIEAGLKANPVSRTPAPLNTTGSRSTSSAKALTDQMSIDEFWDRRRKFIAKSR